MIFNEQAGGQNINLMTLNATENTTYNAPAGVAYDVVEVNVPPVANPYLEEWDFTSNTPTIGKLHGAVPATVSGVTFDSSGAIFPSTYNGYIKFMSLINFDGATIEIDVGSMQLNLSNQYHHRFIMATIDAGLIYRSNGKWSFFGSSWATDSNITDPSFFENSTVKIHVDENGFWHIYKNGTLVYEPNRSYSLTGNWVSIGSQQYSIDSTVITGLRCL